MIKPGIYANLENKQYHLPAGISRSALMEFKRSPYHYFSKYTSVDAPREESTPMMIFGEAFHTYVLEPHLFVDKFAFKPEPVLLKNTDRATYEAHKKLIEDIEKSGKHILNATQMHVLQSMSAALIPHRELIDGGAIEQSYFWYDEETELLVKSRPDILHHNMIVDLKTCNDASPRAFQRAMVDYGYHIQGAMIRDAVRTLENREINNVINIAVEKNYPYAVGIYIIDEEALNIGEIEYKSLLKELKHCIITKEFPGYQPQTISLPRWAL